jgi:hypothetical protein
MVSEATREARVRDASSPLRIGLAFGLATVVLGVVDYLSIALSVDWTIDVGPEALRFSPRMLVALPLIVGALTAFAASLLARLSPGRARSLIIDGVLALPLLACIPALFGGAAIAASPLRWPLMVTTLVITSVAVGALRRLSSWAQSRMPESDKARQTIGASALLAAIAAAVAPAYLSARILRNLYPTFHGALALVALGGATAALLVVLAANGRPGEAAPRVPAMRRAAGSLAAGIALWASLIGLCARSATGRNALIEHAAFASTIVPAMFAIDAAVAAASAPQIVPPASAGVPLSRARFDSSKPKPHIVLITIDAMRGDAMREDSRYAPCTTQLRALAKHQVEFTRAYAPSNSTVYSLPGLLTGLVRAGSETARALYLPAVLSENGYETEAWVTRHNTTHIENDMKRLRTVGFHFQAYKGSYHSADDVAAWALENLAREEPQLVWVHMSDLHAPYSLPPGPPIEGCTMPGDEYGPRLATLDRTLAAFIAALDARGDVVWAFTADHGESRGERGVYGHGSSLFNEQLRVPLMFGGAGVGSAVVDTPVTALDLPATLLEIAGATLPQDAPRLPWRQAAQAARSRPAISFADKGCTITHDRLKLLLDHQAGTLLLFDLTNDPQEQNNIAAANPAAANELFRMLAPPSCSEAAMRLSWLLPK